MKEMVSLLLIGISLSMDTFSLSLSLGTLNQANTKLYLLPYFVGILHFIMPLIGNLLGLEIINWLNLTTNKILGIILIILAFNIAYHFFKEENPIFNLSIGGLIVLAISVSIDSFSVGLGLSALTNRYAVAGLIFAICSFLFTYLGLSIGKYCSQVLGKFANCLGITLLFILGVMHLFK